MATPSLRRTPSGRSQGSKRNFALRPQSTTPSSRASPHNDANLDTSGRVRVMTRIRPPFEAELLERGYAPAVSTAPGVASLGSVQKLVVASPSEQAREYSFDRVFGIDASQEEVYMEAGRPLLESALQGYHGTLLCYGQTGTGKTYTMGILTRVGSEHGGGIIPSTLQDLFQFVSQHPEFDWSIRLSCLQVYLEAIQDLFNPDAENLSLREDQERGVFVEGITEIPVQSFESAAELIDKGLENRIMASQGVNETSSRSHIVLTVHIDRRVKTEADKWLITSGCLTFVDLAGSERVRRTVSSGSRLDEAKFINGSLSALGNVVSALSDPKVTHVPFRDSKITRLLQNSLGGNSKTVLIATVGPSVLNVHETVSTLQFACRCMDLRLKAARLHEHEETDKERCTRLQKQVDEIQAYYQQREDGLRQLYDEQVQDLTQQAQAIANNYSNTLEHSEKLSALFGIAMKTVQQLFQASVELARQCRVIDESTLNGSQDMYTKNNHNSALEENSVTKPLPLSEDALSLSPTVTKPLTDYESSQRLQIDMNKVLDKSNMIFSYLRTQLQYKTAQLQSLTAQPTEDDFQSSEAQSIHTRIDSRTASSQHAVGSSPVKTPMNQFIASERSMSGQADSQLVSSSSPSFLASSPISHSPPRKDEATYDAGEGKKLISSVFGQLNQGIGSLVNIFLREPSPAFSRLTTQLKKNRKGPVAQESRNRFRRERQQYRESITRLKLNDELNRRLPLPVAATKGRPDQANANVNRVDRISKESATRSSNESTSRINTESTNQVTVESHNATTPASFGGNVPLKALITRVESTSEPVHLKSVELAVESNLPLQNGSRRSPRISVQHEPTANSPLNLSSEPANNGFNGKLPLWQQMNSVDTADTLLESLRRKESNSPVKTVGASEPVVEGLFAPSFSAPIPGYDMDEHDMLSDDDSDEDLTAFLGNWRSVNNTN
eukprot:GILK01012801.1.p1 GENE.GILK01012801.1~~GILK01012801.1.p1  ORF type:complete len:968 (+),score=214.11 GILK01012801.1:43-2904(+)